MSCWRNLYLLQDDEDSCLYCIESFIVLPFIFKSATQVELMFVYEARQDISGHPVADLSLVNEKTVPSPGLSGAIFITIRCAYTPACRQSLWGFSVAEPCDNTTLSS